MKYTLKIIKSLFLISFFGLVWTLECAEGEVDLGWGDCNYIYGYYYTSNGCMTSGCFSIEETIEINISYISLGEFPQNISELTNLSSINISDCGLTGEIPAGIENLQSLVRLWIYDNDLDISDSLGINTNLYGEIPLEIGSLENLQSINLSNNELEGPIPDELSNLSSLAQLILSGNKLSGEIPLSLMGLENLESLSLSDNQLAGQIPADIGNLANITFLSLSNNQLTGNIPSRINSLASIYFLDLSYNNLTGEIPSDLGSLDLVYLILNNNQLTGQIPSALGDQSLLYQLDLSNNSLTGNLPAELQNLDLFFLLLNNNQLTGELPDVFCDYYSVDLSDNQFCPEYPECLSADEIGYQDISICGECSELDGDVNYDGAIDILDAVSTVNCILSGECSWCSDYNGDGFVDVLDIVVLISIILEV